MTAAEDWEDDIRRALFRLMVADMGRSYEATVCILYGNVPPALHRQAARVLRDSLGIPETQRNTAPTVSARLAHPGVGIQVSTSVRL